MQQFQKLTVLGWEILSVILIGLLLMNLGTNSRQTSDTYALKTQFKLRSKKRCKFVGLREPAVFLEIMLGYRGQYSVSWLICLLALSCWHVKVSDSWTAIYSDHVTRLSYMYSDTLSGEVFAWSVSHTIAIDRLESSILVSSNRTKGEGFFTVPFEWWETVPVQSRRKGKVHLPLHVSVMNKPNLKVFATAGLIWQMQ